MIEYPSDFYNFKLAPDNPSRRDSYDRSHKLEHIVKELHEWNVPIQVNSDPVVISFVYDHSSYSWWDLNQADTFENPSSRFPIVDDLTSYPSGSTVTVTTGITYPTTITYPGIMIPAGTFSPMPSPATIYPGVSPLPGGPYPSPSPFKDQPIEKKEKEIKHLEIDINKILDGLKGLEIEEDDWSELSLTKII